MPKLFGLLVRGVLVAEAAIFFILYSSGLLSLIFCCRVVAMLANSTLKCNYFSHNLSLV